MSYLCKCNQKESDTQQELFIFYFFSIISVSFSLAKHLAKPGNETSDSKYYVSSARRPDGYAIRRKKKERYGLMICPRLLYMIERFMNVYQAVFPLFIWSFQEKSVILQ